MLINCCDIYRGKIVHEIVCKNEETHDVFKKLIYKNLNFENIQPMEIYVYVLSDFCI